MRLIKHLLAVLLIPAISFAQPYTAQEEQDRLINLGMTSELAVELTDYINGDGILSVLLPNNVYLKARNAADTADLDLLKADATDDTVLNADTGDVIKFSIAGTTELTLSDNVLTFSGSSARIDAGGSLILSPVSDGNRLVTFAASSDTVITETFGDGGTTAAQTYTISASTADADDDAVLTIAGGGGTATTRGSSVQVTGNESSGHAIIASGGAAGADIYIRATDDISFDNGTTPKWVLDTPTGTLAAVATGGTIAIDSGTAASACKGTLTANGATPVVTNTTCAATSSIPFLQKTNASTAVNGSCTVTSISNGVSFTVECLATDTGTYSWFILKEG